MEGKPERKLLRPDILIPLAIAFGMAVLLKDTIGGPPRPLLLPRVVELGTLVLCIIVAIENFVKGMPADVKENPMFKEVGKLVLTFIGVLCFPLGTYLIGFLPTGMLLILVVFLAWGGEKKIWRHLIIGEALVVALIWGIMMTLLQYEYPKGVLIKLLFG